MKHVLSRSMLDDAWFATDEYIQERVKDLYMDTWNTDGRWRRVRVSSEYLSEVLACGVPAGITTNAPADLRVVGLDEVRAGPAGWYAFVVWSATFDPLPMNNGRLTDAIPFVDFVYTRHC